MNALLDWMIVGAGLAMGRLLVGMVAAVIVITIGIAVLAVFFIWEEKTK